MNDIMRGTFDPNSGLAAQGDDNKVFAQFYTRAVNDGLASKEAGRPISRNVPYVKIIQPGESRLSVYDQPATDQDVARFPRQWAAFQNGKQMEISGTMLSVLFPADPAVVENLKSLNFHTVEQLAEANDTAIQQIGMGGQQWRDKARQYIAAADKGKDYHVLSKKLEELTNARAADQQKIAAMEAALAQAETKRGPGRPPKHSEAA